MSAPDKIYVHVRKEPRPSITFSEAPEENSSNIEYLRKDALLEWAKEEQNKWEECINKAKTDPELIRSAAFCSGAKSQIEDLIDKLNSM